MKKRLLACLLTAAMLTSLFPLPALAAEAEPYTGGLCYHHQEHSFEVCGYVKAVEGHPCGHVHDGTCGYVEAVPEVPCDMGCAETDGDGQIVHGEGCAYTPAVEGASCQHKHDSECGYVEAVEGQPCGYVCRICPVQALIDALPAPEDITANNRAEAEAQLAAIDTARAELTDEELEQLNTSHYQAVVSALAALDEQAGADVPMLADDPAEQFPALTPGNTYWFDLSREGIPGTVNTGNNVLGTLTVPDTTLHWVPFTYAGTINAYKLDSSQETSKEYADQNKYDHSLFIADYNVTHTVSWRNLNASNKNLIFGKAYTSGGVGYTLRAPSAGSYYVNNGDENQRSTPQSNEWDVILDKGAAYIKNWSEIYSWGQDTYAVNPVIRGKILARYWYNNYAGEGRLYIGFRPVLELPAPNTLTSGISVVTLNLNGGKVGTTATAQDGPVNIVVKSGESFTAPSGEGLTAPEGKVFGGWTNSGTTYAADATVPADVSELTVVWATAPAITTQPENKTVSAGEAATFTVTASGEPAPTYKWQVNKGSGWEDIPGATNSNYTIAATSGTMNGWKYRCVATNSAGSVTSSEATLTVNKLTPTAGDFTFNAPADLTYSGTAKEARVASTAAGTGKITVHYFDKAGKAVDKPENAGTYTVKIDVAEGENYAAASGLTDERWTFTITKASSPASVTKPLNIANHLERTYTFALSYLRPAIEGGWGEVSYEFTASFTKSGYYTSGAEITAGPGGVPNTLTLPIQFNDTTDEGTVGTVTVTLHSQNYGDYTGTINIVASNKTVVTFSGVEGVTTPYTGQSVEGYKGTLAVTTQNDEAVNVNDLTLEISYTGRLDTSYESTQPPTDVGTYFVVFRAADTDEHYIGREHFAFEITKATPTGEPKYTAITTSGKTLADAALTTAGGTFSVPGTVAWELDETTTVEANTAYKWIFTPTDTHNYTTLEGNVTLWQRSSGGNTGDSTGGNTDGNTDGNSGGWYNPPTTYSVTIPTTAHGKVTVSPTSASRGATVTITAVPEDGYRLSSIDVTSGGKDIALTEKGSGKYTFTMPAGTVKVTATFVPAETPETPWNNPFADVSEGDWYYEAVQFVQERGLMNGYSDGRFGPNDTLSRAQLAQILFNKEGRPGVNYLLTFSDVAGEAWYTEAIRWATSQGIVSGYGNGTFGPNDPITREQLAVMLWRYSGSPAATNKELHFNDESEISGFALEALRWAVESGILNGYGDGRLGPQGQATRAQVAQMLKNFIENQEENA